MSSPSIPEAPSVGDDPQPEDAHLNPAEVLDGRGGTLPSRPRAGQLLRLVVDALADDGAGLCRVRVGNPPSTSDWRVEVRHALPGEQVLAQVGRAGRGVAEARLLHIGAHSDDRVAPACRHAGPYDGGERGCGGCALQHLQPAALSRAKRARLCDAFTLAGLDTACVVDGPPVQPAFGMRTKMEFSFADDGDRQPALGLHPPGFQHQVVAITSCDHLPERALAILLAAAAWQRRRGVPRYDGRRQGGWLRTLGLRIGVRTGFVGVELGTSNLDHVALDVGAVAEGDAPASAPAEATALAAELAALLAALPAPPDACWWTRTHVQRGEPTRSATAALFGALQVPQRLLLADRAPLELTLHPAAFFQPHAAGAEAIANAVRALVARCAPARVLDLYCGVGMIGLAVADLCESLVGVELIAEAVAAAEANAARNGIGHARFLAGDAAATLRAHGLDATDAFDLVIVDPPRAGLAAAALSSLVAVGARDIVYVSCHPGSLARDLVGLCAAGWQLQQVLTLDPFPATMHLESVAWLRRAAAGAETP